MTVAAPDAALPERLFPVGREWLGLGGVIAVHVLALAGLVVALKRPEPVRPPTILGMLVSTPELAVEPPKPLPVQPETRPRPTVPRRPAPLPPPVAEASERAVQAPPVTAPPEPVPAVAVAAAAPAPAPPAPPEPAPAPAPVVPPRSDAAHLNNPAPQYPAASRRMGEQGRVLFDVYILADGSVGEVRLKKSSGYARLDDAALDAVRRWRYVPARRGDAPIPFWYVQPVSFALES